MGKDIIMLESKKDSFVHSFNLSEKQTPVFSTATIISLRFSFFFLGGVGGVGWEVNILYSYTYTIGSGYTNKNKFRIVKETLISFNSTIGILWDLEISS